MTELQTKLLQMMKWFHEYCEANNLQYFALGGTVLGAVRHNGFIPWDDDIDVGMPRKDYNRLIELMKNSSNEKYLLEVPLENKDYVHPFAKIYDCETTFVEDMRYKAVRGIYLDIFPLDGIGNTLEESAENYKYIDKKTNLINVKVCNVIKRRGFFKNFAIVVGRIIPPFILSWRRQMKKLIEESQKRDYYEYKYVGNLVGRWHFKEVMERSIFGTPKLHQFEDMQIYLPEDYDKYLKTMYGDYMKLPPEDKRSSNHEYIFLDLNKPYKQKN